MKTNLLSLKVSGLWAMIPAMLVCMSAAMAQNYPGPGGDRGFPGGPAGPGGPGGGGGFNNDSAGRQAAFQACQKLGFQNQVNQCIQTVQQTRSIDTGAAQFCGTQIVFTSNIVSCLSTIAEKTYELYELRTCSNSHFDDDRIQCLQVTGRRLQQQPLPGQANGGYSNTCGFLTVPQVQSEISRALTIIRNPEAIRILQNVQIQLDRGAGAGGGRRF